MAQQPATGFFTLNPRRKPWNVLLDPSLQLKLPLYLVLLSAVFAAALAVHTWLSFGRVIQLALQEGDSPRYFHRVMEAQTTDFAIAFGAMAAAYVIAIVVLCVVHAHRMIGPTVAFRRHIEALKNGDFTSRIRLREGDAFAELAGDLNELADVLAEQAKPAAPAPSGAPPPGA